MNKSTLLFLALGTAILSGLFLLLRPDAEVERPSGSPPQTFELVIEDGKLVSGSSLLRVRQGEAVRMTVTSDAADELHMHGYDLHLDLRAGEPAVLQFTADHAGHFDIELHQANLELGALEVQPK